MMSDGVVSIGDGKQGGEFSPSAKRRGSHVGATSAATAPIPAGRVKRSPQGSVAGESSTKGSERDEMEEVSNEEGGQLLSESTSDVLSSILFLSFYRLRSILFRRK